MKRVATALVLIPVVFAIIFFAPDWLFIAVLGLIAVISIREFLRLIETMSTPPKTLATVTVIVLFVAMWAASSGPLAINDVPRGIATFVLIGLAFFSVFMFLGWSLGTSNPRASIPGASLAFAGVVYICLPLSCLYAVRSTDFVGNYLLVVLFVLVWSGDVAALYVGKALGRHKLAPSVSPGKTWEGSCASLACSALVSVAIMVYVVPKLPDSLTRHFALDHRWVSLRISPAPIWWAVAVGIGINIAAQIGDLVESLIKRAAGVKDSGTFLPGHGGMLDRIDALLFAAPIGWLLLTATGEYFQHATPIWHK
jgi:phosphatidate cytidylyltransferase